NDLSRQKYEWPFAAVHQHQLIYFGTRAVGNLPHAVARSAEVTALLCDYNVARSKSVIKSYESGSVGVLRRDDREYRHVFIGDRLRQPPRLREKLAAVRCIRTRAGVPQRPQRCNQN